MNRNTILLIMIIVVAITIPLATAVVSNDKATIAQTKQNDNAVRTEQTFNIKSVEKGSQINNAFAVINLDSFIGDQCVLVLNESHLNKDVISDPFICNTSNSVELLQKGNHALESKIYAEEFNISIRSLTSDETIPLPSEDLSLTIFYTTPRYYAELENDIVINVIVADDEFILSQSGTWIETFMDNSQRGHYAGIGNTFDSTLDIFISPQPYSSWTLDITTGYWLSPIPYPNDGEEYVWDEINQSWELM